MTTEKQMGLLELQNVIKERVEGTFGERIWVRAEISELHNHSSGHCYITLIEKDLEKHSILAKVPAIIWSSSYRVLRPYFETTTGSPLAVGMNVLVKVQVVYSQLYSLSLIIYDIDPSFTMGELEIARQKTIKRLQDEGMFDMNSGLDLPQLPRRFAVISGKGAAGYRDFFRHLHENEYGFKFSTTLFEAPMQGEDSPKGIIAALESVAKQMEEFDAVLILRGGGGAMDLICFDDYDLAVNVAQFPLPVLTGIGHDHDYHVIDMVAHTNVKTPTALADYIIDLFSGEDYRLSALASRLSLAITGKYAKEESIFASFISRLSLAVAEKYSKELNKIDLLEQRVVKGNPLSILESGYCLVEKGGKKVDSIDPLSPGDTIRIRMKGGAAECVIKETIKN